MKLLAPRLATVILGHGLALLLLSAAYSQQVPPYGAKADASRHTGQAVAPQTAVQELWKGDVKNEHLHFLIIRDGRSISGWLLGREVDYTDRQTKERKHSVISKVPIDIVGETSETSGIQFEDGTFVYKGKFETPDSMVGMRVSGKVKMPFRFERTGVAGPSDIPSPLPATTADWNLFLIRFKNAVRLHDQNALKRMMARRFELAEDLEASPDEVLRNLDWKQLARAMSFNVGRCPYKPTTVKQANCAIDAHPCPKCVYEVFIGFQKGQDNQWRWSSIVYPGD